METFIVYNKAQMNRKARHIIIIITSILHGGVRAIVSHIC
jgi:hypothetical protein